MNEFGIRRYVDDRISEGVAISVLPSVVYGIDHMQGMAYMRAIATKRYSYGWLFRVKNINRFFSYVDLWLMIMRKEILV